LKPRKAKHLAAGVDHGPVYIDGESRQPEPFNLFVEERAVECDHGLERRLGELLEPVHHGALRGEPREPAEPGNEGIAGEVAEVLQPAGPHHEEGDDEEHQAGGPVVAPESIGAEALAEAPVQVEEPEVPPQELQPAVRGEVLLHELDSQITFDRSTETCYSQAHDRGLLCEESWLAPLSWKTTREALLFHSTHTEKRSLFSDWGR
jgi:hypothetical protein